MPKMRPVEYRGRHLGDLRVYGVEDWVRKDKQPGEADFKLISVTAGADLVREILEREPLRVGTEEPDKPWITVVVREVAMAVAGRQDDRTEEDILFTYVNRHGMGQILEIWGADVGELAAHLRASSGVEDAEN